MVAPSPGIAKKRVQIFNSKADINSQTPNVNNDGTSRGEVWSVKSEDETQIVDQRQEEKSERVSSADVNKWYIDTLGSNLLSKKYSILEDARSTKYTNKELTSQNYLLVGERNVGMKQGGSFANHEVTLGTPSKVTMNHSPPLSRPSPFGSPTN